MIRNFALAALLMTGLAACMGGTNPTAGNDGDMSTDTGDALANPSDGFENENQVE